MSIRIEFTDPTDAARLVDAALAEADRVEAASPMLAMRYRRIAEDLGDALDRSVPAPSGFATTRGRGR